MVLDNWFVFSPPPGFAVEEESAAGSGTSNEPVGEGDARTVAPRDVPAVTPETPPEATKDEEEEKKPAAKQPSPFSPRSGFNPYDRENIEATLAALEAEEKSPPVPTTEGGEVPVTDADNPEDTPATTPDPKKKYAGTFESPEALEQGYENLRQKLDEMGNEIGTLRKQVQPEPESTGQTQTQGQPQQQFDPATGFPLDEYGIPFRPAEWWSGQRWEELTEFFEDKGGEPAALAYYNQEMRQWQEEYGQRRGAAQQQASNAEQVEIQNLGRQQAEEIPKEQQRLLDAFLAVHPEEEAKKRVQAVFAEAAEIVKNALDRGAITVKTAYRPEIVKESVGEALKKMYMEGRLSDVLYPKPGTSLAPMRSPQASGGQGGGGGGPQRNGSNGQSSKAKVKVTQEDIIAAKALTNAGRKTTPEELAEEREADEKESR